MKFFEKKDYGFWIVLEPNKPVVEEGEELVFTVEKYGFKDISISDVKHLEVEITIHDKNHKVDIIKDGVEEGDSLVFNTSHWNPGNKKVEARYEVKLKRSVSAGGSASESGKLQHEGNNHIRIVEFPLVKEIKLNSPSLNPDVENRQLWNLIRYRTIDFKKYHEVMDDIMACNLGSVRGRDVIKDRDEKQLMKNRLPFLGVNSYSLLKFATEAYMKSACGIHNRDMGSDYFTADAASSTKLLPYIDLVYDKIGEYSIRDNNDECFDENEIIRARMQPLFIELIWSYWHDEGSLGRTMDAISLRFQNVRNSGRDPLSRLDIDPLRPLNNLIWGHIQDKQHRLSVTRRIYEYDHHYGLNLTGHSVPVNSADSRSKFIEAFHNLLFKCSQYFKDVDDMTRRADGFPLLNALKEVHLILAEGAHNQFGDLPTTARAEMLVEQYLLARPEIREFLGGKIMVPYTEPWQDRVDTMKNMQGWSDTSVSYFSKLAKYGEQLILSIRYDNWSEINDSAAAGNWAIFWRNEIQQYIHSYFAVTGADLSIETVGSSNVEKYLLPSILIQKKLQFRSSSYFVR